METFAVKRRRAWRYRGTTSEFSSIDIEPRSQRNPKPKKNPGRAGRDGPGRVANLSGPPTPLSETHLIMERIRM